LILRWAEIITVSGKRRTLLDEQIVGK